MKTFSIFLIVFAVALSGSLNLRAQTATGNNSLTMGIPAIALLATDVSAVTLQLTTSTAGEAISGGIGTTHVQISSIVTSGNTRKINASVTGVPAGTSLAVSATVPTNGNFGGTVGTGLPDITLTASAADLVTGIGSCFTGTASDDGYVLDYEWDSGVPGSYGTIVELSGGTATVVLTLTDDI